MPLPLLLGIGSVLAAIASWASRAGAAAGVAKNFFTIFLNFGKTILVGLAAIVGIPLASNVVDFSNSLRDDKVSRILFIVGAAGIGFFLARLVSRK